MSSKSPPVILVAHANDREDGENYLRELPGELKRIRAAMKPAKSAGLCMPVERANVTPDEIFEVFRDYRDQVAIFHFAGHTSSAELLFETSDGAQQVVQAGGLAAYLAQQKGLVLVFINGCSSGDQVDGLICAGVPAVIATKAEIEDGIATKFAENFYKSLASGASIQKAFFEAKAAITSVCESPADACNHDHEDYDEDDSWPWDLYQGKKTLGLADRWKLTASVGNAPGSRIKIPQLLPYMADRSKQRDQLEDALIGHLDEHARRPLITIVSGDEREEHTRFVERLHQVTLPKLMALNNDTGSINLVSLDWGYPGGKASERFERLRKEIAKKLANNRAAGPDECVAALSIDGRPVMVVTTIYSQNWERDEPEMIAMFKRFWQEWPDLPAGQTMVIVVSFILKNCSQESIWKALRNWKAVKNWNVLKKMRKQNKSVQDFIESSANSNPPGISLVVLDPLSSLKEEDLKKWIENEVTEFSRKQGGGPGGVVGLTEAMTEWVESRFRKCREETGDSKIQMRDLGMELQKKLSRYINEGGI
jgi:hypothetical protein